MKSRETKSPYPILSVQGRNGQSEGQSENPSNSPLSGGKQKSPSRGGGFRGSFWEKRGVRAFTLVELIIVITILAILATIAFMSFQGYAKQSRDSNRLTTIKTIEKGVDLFLTKSGKIPAPDEATAFTGGSADNPVKISQGTVGAQMVQVINMNQVPLDPKTQAKYHYSVFGETPYYQIGIEQEQDSVSYISPTFADSEEVMISGNYTFDPSLPSLFVVEDSVGSGGIFHLSTCFIVDGWENSFSSSSGNCVKKSQMLASGLDTSLVGYWDMETCTGTGGQCGVGDKLKDLSGNGNVGSFSGTTKPTKTTGLFSGAYYFGSGGTSNNTGFIQILGTNFNNLPNGLTISMIVKTNTCSPGGFMIMKSGPQVNAIGYQTGSIDYSNKINRYNWGNYQSSLNCSNDNLTFYAVSQIPDYTINTSDYISGVYFSALNGVVNINRPVLLDNKYHIITSTVDGNGNTRRLYIDGSKMSENTVLTINKNFGIRKSVGDLFLGSTIYNSNGVYSKGPQFNGLIDEVKLYNKVLSDQEIAQQARIAGF